MQNCFTTGAQFDTTTDSSFAKPSLLIVDDEAEITAILQEVFEPDYRVCIANDGASALRVLVSEPKPDLVLLDNDLPDMPGLEIGRRIKANPSTRNIAIVFLTGLNDNLGELRALELGAADYITKPFDVALLRARVRNQIDIKRRADNAEALACVDTLTSLPNRRRFESVLSSEWERAIRYQFPVSLLMIDIDHFKGYNDHYGHQQGDYCLREVARAMAKGLSRPSDLLARYGGEEFVAILPDTAREGARKVAEQLLKRVVSLALPHIAPDTNVTVSIGGATHFPSRRIQSSNELLSIADAQLYRAKAMGRNRYCF